MNRYKKLNIGMIAGAVILGTWATLYFEQYCTPVQCYENENENMYQLVSVIFIIHGIIFFILARDYFKVWVRAVLLWFVPLTIYVAFNPGSVNLLFRSNITEAMQFMMYVLSFVSILFVAIRFGLQQMKKRIS